MAIGTCIVTVVNYKGKVKIFAYPVPAGLGGCQMHVRLGPVVQSIVSLTSSLRVISLTVLADSIYNILIFFAEKM